MTIPLDLDAEVRARTLQRLKRIEGQARGIQHMIVEGRDCRDVLQQLAALRSAAHAVSLQMFEEFALHCLQTADDPALRKRMLSDLAQAAARLAT